MTKLNIIMIILLVLAIPFLSASIGSLGTFKQYSCVNLLQTCVDCTYNNISSVTLPNGVGALGLTAMAQSGIEFTHSFCNTTLSGTSNVNGFGDAGGAMTKWNYVFEVTPSGGAEDNTTIFLFLICLTTLFFFMGVFMKNYIFVTIAGFALMSSGVYGMIYGFGDITSLYTRTISYIVIGLGMIITVTSGLELVKEIYDGTGKENEEDED